MHFGASKVQLSLHTGVKYSKREDLFINSFVTVSKELDHAAPGIWAHLTPIFKKINSNVDSLHIASDGPTGQYRNKYNFYLLTKLLPTICPNVERCSWNFRESGHGKGPINSVGGTLKRTLERTLIITWPMERMYIQSNNLSM